MNLDGITVPDGWTKERAYAGSDRFVLIRSPHGYMAMLDLDLRGFRSGHVSTGRLVNTERFTGRGWRAALAAVAVAHL